mmetsp:Transcript_31484/g.80260  ORF Transcript_31484/g.80260 Transcript_31484/m.80260 type:complete len:276 (+) Transcript_31484:139-966(+)
MRSSSGRFRRISQSLITSREFGAGCILFAICCSSTVRCSWFCAVRAAIRFCSSSIYFFASCSRSCLSCLVRSFSSCFLSFLDFICSKRYSLFCCRRVSKRALLAFSNSAACLSFSSLSACVLLAATSECFFSDAASEAACVKRARRICSSFSFASFATLSRSSLRCLYSCKRFSSSSATFCFSSSRLRRASLPTSRACRANTRCCPIDSSFFFFSSCSCLKICSFMALASSISFSFSSSLRAWTSSTCAWRSCFWTIIFCCRTSSFSRSCSQCCL